MTSMDKNLIELSEFLPTHADIIDISKDDIEANFILKKSVEYTTDWPANLKSEAAEEIGYLINSLVDKYWERIHCGHFSTVKLSTRRIYAIACYFKIFFLLLENPSNASHIEQCNAILDDAQLLGSTEGLERLHSALMKFLNKNKEEKSYSRPLPVLSPLKRRTVPCDVPQLNAPTITEFQTQCFQPMQPTLLLHTIDHWPAITKWRNLNYLLAVAGNRTVPVEIGTNYANDEWSQQLVKMRDFLYRQFSENDGDGNVEYLAQHELFSQIPDLKADICIPDYCTVGENALNEVDIKAWLGPQGTTSPMHYDPKHNLLCQVFGCKRIILAAPEDTHNLYPHDSEFLSNTSQIDAAHPDLLNYPLVEDVKFYKLLLQPGDCLYLPPKWWHYVYAETPSFSVSFWWQ